MKKRNGLLLLLLMLGNAVLAQVSTKLAAAMEEFNKDEQLKYATAALHVVDAVTGKTVYTHNAYKGLATASTLKVITAATAFDILGKDYTYQTKVGIISTHSGHHLYIQASGDPTFGSWRWKETKDSLILGRIKEAVRASGVKSFESVMINTTDWEADDDIPGGWIWEDIGQYYGAGAQGLNWRENQFDVILKSGPRIGDAVTIVKTIPYLYDYTIVSKASAAGKGTGDRSALYYPSKGKRYSELRGTIPLGENNFTVSGSIYDPAGQFAKTVIDVIKDIAIVKNNKVEVNIPEQENVNWIYTHTSPQLSEIIYWFLRKSINLYGEALLRTIALKVKGKASTSEGIEVLQQHWVDKGIDKEELHLYDGSGLSPQNRVTAHAEVMVLKYAKERPWFKEFYEGMPVYNDMKMKSGTINRVKGFAGYHQSKAGKEYIFAILVNNYSKSATTLVRKMYRVLDHLK
ncbi:D-alanyl-D-alanine carboxypeptidase DacC [Mycovorax composti]|jgi:D-alanyl-D-alanine carboxypeptidase, serine-type, PBP4 family|uniref:D-alanyl-D-alanine carboxypeptidase DacC n=1 Tax=Mycovorax composti TaxID=2962693 RepID=A0ABZ2EPG8_9BACT